MTEQIFVNLLTNAINYSPEEGGLIEIRAEIRTEANKVRLFVRKTAGTKFRRGAG